MNTIQNSSLPLWFITLVLHSLGHTEREKTHLANCFQLARHGAWKMWRPDRVTEIQSQQFTNVHQLVGMLRMIWLFCCFKQDFTPIKSSNLYPKRIYTHGLFVQHTHPFQIWKSVVRPGISTVLVGHVKSSVTARYYSSSLFLLEVCAHQTHLAKCTVPVSVLMLTWAKTNK